MPHSSTRFEAIALRLANYLLFIASIFVIGSYIPHALQWLDTVFSVNSPLLDSRQNQILWFLAELSNFRIQMAEASVLLFAIMIVVYFGVLKSTQKARHIILLANTIAMICIAPLIPYYLPRPKVATTADSVKILHYNVLFTNRNKDALTRYVEKENPDIVSLQEYTDWWHYEIAYSKVFRKYPYRFISRQGGDAVFSKRELINPHLEWISGSLASADVSIITQIKIANRPVTFLFSHTPIPLFPDLYPRLIEHFRFWKKKYQYSTKNLVFIGDFNTTPWTLQFQQIMQNSPLRDSQLGFGLQPSFPVNYPLLRIPIDHCLVSKNVIVQDRHLGPALGSDHLPVIIRLALKQY